MVRENDPVAGFVTFGLTRHLSGPNILTYKIKLSSPHPGLLRGQGTQTGEWSLAGRGESRDGGQRSVCGGPGRAARILAALSREGGLSQSWAS